MMVPVRSSWIVCSSLLWLLESSARFVAMWGRRRRRRERTEEARNRRLNAMLDVVLCLCLRGVKGALHP